MNLDRLLKEKQVSFTNIYDSWHQYSSLSNKETLDMGDLNAKHDLQQYRSILFAGMGGSATAGEIAASVLDGAKVKCSVLKGSTLPDSVDRNTLVIASSVSGFTYETIQILKSCQKRGIDVVTLSSGGYLERLSKSSGIFHIAIKNLGAPRVSLPCLVYPVLNIIKQVEPGIGRQIDSSLAALEELSKRINSSVVSEKNPAKQLALFMQSVMPICYYSSCMKPAGVRFKNSLNENAKTQSMADDIEESCHNSVVPFSFEDKGRYGVMLLRSNKDDRILAKRFDIVREFLTKLGVQTYELYGFGDSLLANIMSAIYLLDYSTVYLACVKGYDPTVTPAIDHIKSSMSDLF